MWDGGVDLRHLCLLVRHAIAVTDIELIKGFEGLHSSVVANTQ